MAYSPFRELFRSQDPDKRLLAAREREREAIEDRLYAELGLAKSAGNKHAVEFASDKISHYRSIDAWDAAKFWQPSDAWYDRREAEREARGS